MESQATLAAAGVRLPPGTMTVAGGVAERQGSTTLTGDGPTLIPIWVTPGYKSTTKCSGLCNGRRRAPSGLPLLRDFSLSRVGRFGLKGETVDRESTSPHYMGVVSSAMGPGYGPSSPFREIADQLRNTLDRVGHGVHSG
jgi:hypothetical protein